MDGIDSTTAPRFRLGRQRQASITFIQAGQQIRQTRFHRPERVIVPDRHMRILPPDSYPRLKRHATQKRFTRSGLVIYLRLLKVDSIYLPNYCSELERM